MEIAGDVYLPKEISVDELVEEFNYKSASRSTSSPTIEKYVWTYHTWSLDVPAEDVKEVEEKQGFFKKIWNNWYRNIKNPM